jgi:hypothetical protein
LKIDGKWGFFGKCGAMSGCFPTCAPEIKNQVSIRIRSGQAFDSAALSSEGHGCFLPGEGWRQLQASWGNCGFDFMRMAMTWSENTGLMKGMGMQFSAKWMRMGRKHAYSPAGREGFL